MTNTTVAFLANYYNMTIHTFKKRDYLLEVNPKYTNPSYSDYLNVIDARWIDINTGLFIDITAVRPHEELKDVICSKDQHEEKVRPVHGALSQASLLTIALQVDDLFPLRDSLFEGQAVKIPYNYAKLLTIEYGKASLIKTRYSG